MLLIQDFFTAGYDQIPIDIYLASGRDIYLTSGRDIYLAPGRKYEIFTTFLVILA